MNYKRYLLVIGIFVFLFTAFHSYSKALQSSVVVEVLEIDIKPEKRKYFCIEHIDCRTLAQAIYYEARGEPLEGQIAVAHVIINRVKSKHFPNTVYGVVNQKYQFSYLNKSKKNIWYRDFESYKRAEWIALKVISGEFDDPTNGSEFYLNPHKLKKLPKWSSEFVKVAVINNHHFYKN